MPFLGSMVTSQVLLLSEVNIIIQHTLLKVSFWAPFHALLDSEVKCDRKVKGGEREIEREIEGERQTEREREREKERERERDPGCQASAYMVPSLIR